MDYFDRPEMSNSKLNEFERQIKGSQSWRFDAGQITDKSRDLGHLFHAALFEPHKYQEVLAGCTTVEAKELKLIADMKKSASRFYSLQHFIQHPNTEFEKEEFGEVFGVPFKIKMDACNRMFHCIGDGKSTAARTFDQFIESCNKFHYWRQAFNYKTVAKLKCFYFWGVSKVKPYDIFYVDTDEFPEQMEQAEKDVKWLCGEWLEHQKKAQDNIAYNLRVQEILQGIKG